MSNFHRMPDAAEKDQQLWEMAKARAGFKGHLAAYIFVNLFLWGIWFFTGLNNGHHYTWPVWPTLGWGIGLTMHYLGVYVFPQQNQVQKEYEKLKNRQ